MFSKAVLTVKDLVMPTGLRQTTEMKIEVGKSSTVAGQTTFCNNTILTDRALKMYREQTEVCSTYGECLFTATT